MGGLVSKFREKSPVMYKLRETFTPYTNLPLARYSGGSERFKEFGDELEKSVRDLFGLSAHSAITATYTPSPACRAHGGPFVLLDSKNAMIAWIVLQVLIVPVCAFVIMLGGAPDVFPCLSGRVVPDGTGEEGIVVKDLVAVRVDGPVGLMRKKSRDRGILATVFMVVACMMLVLQGFAIGASRFCAAGVDFAEGLVEKVVSGGEKSAFWALPYGLFALVSCGLTLFALMSTVKCWRGYAELRKVERDLLGIEQAGEEGERNEAFEMQSVSGGGPRSQVA
jgi:hypothetical protein